MTTTYLVVRTSPESARVPERCARWAERNGVGVDVIGPVGPREVHAHLDPAVHAGVVLELEQVAGDDAVARTIARAAIPVFGVSRAELPDDTAVVAASCARVFAGRGTCGFIWALSHLHAQHEHPPRTLRYGPHPAHVADLRVPDGGGRPPAVVLAHGGFWRHEWERDLMDGLALDLSRRGYATWNVEYRRVGPTGGGWPQTADDVVRATTALPMHTDDRVDLDRVVLLGHSAGAQLALRAAAELRDRHRVPALVVALSGLFDLDAAARADVGWGSIQAFLGGGPDEVADRYRDAAPVAHVPLGIPTLLAHGTDDAHVPIAQSEAYRARAAAAGDPVELLMLDGADHFAMIDPTTPAWSATVAAIGRRIPVERASSA
jgi:acetyl esterase/lipase